MKFKLLPLTAVFCLALLLPLAAQAGDEEAAASDKPSFSASQTVQLTAMVEVINHETRQVVLRGPQGKLRTITLSENAQNLDQVQVGDTVNIEYVQHMSIEVFTNDGMEPGVGSIAAEANAAKGETPAGMIMESRVVTATVEEINIEANTFKLKWPGDEIKEYVAQDPENLKKAEVGDLVVATYTEALAMSLNEVTAE